MSGSTLIGESARGGGKEVTSEKGCNRVEMLVGLFCKKAEFLVPF